MSTAKQQAFEACMSALYMNPYTEFLGEVDRDDEHWGVFHFGEKPKDMRVTVIMPPTEEVRIRVEWRNYSADARNPLKCEQTHSVRTYAAQQADLEKAVQYAMTAVLETYLDVLNEEGLAGDIERLAPASASDDEE